MSNIKIIAEIGINHNGDLNIAKKIIDVCHRFGCDFVKFQKRTPDICVPDEQKNKMRKTPWGEIKYIDYKKKIEFEKKEYDEINTYCRKLGIRWFTSVWDKNSVDFMKQYPQPDGKLLMKIPSAKITDLELCKYARQNCDILQISTGMSNEEQIEECVAVCNPDIIFHTNSTYPCPIEEINLSRISYMKNKWPNKEIGYSGHEYPLPTTYGAAALGATWIERHVTIDRNMWGSDQSSSVEPNGVYKLVKGVRAIEKSLGKAGPRVLYPGEVAKLKSLRG